MRILSWDHKPRRDEWLPETLEPLALTTQGNLHSQRKDAKANQEWRLFCCSSQRIHNLSQVSEGIKYFLNCSNYELGTVTSTVLTRLWASLIGKVMGKFSWPRLRLNLKSKALINEALGLHPYAIWNFKRHLKTIP